MKKLLLVTLLALGAITYPPVQAKICKFCRSDDFNQLIKDNAHVVVDFYSPSCPPCMRLKPVFEELGTEMNTVLFITVNVQDFSSLASRFGISSIPHLKVFKDGKEIDYSTGYKSKTSLRTWVNSVLS